jgi:hypothetical protein
MEVLYVLTCGGLTNLARVGRYHLEREGVFYFLPFLFVIPVFFLFFFIPFFLSFFPLGFGEKPRQTDRYWETADRSAGVRS